MAEKAISEIIEVSACKHEPMTADDTSKAWVIRIVRDLPGFETLEDAERFYKSEASMIAQTLAAALPGGVLNRLWLEIGREIGEHWLYRGSIYDDEKSAESPQSDVLE